MGLPEATTSNQVTTNLPATIKSEAETTLTKQGIIDEYKNGLADLGFYGIEDPRVTLTQKLFNSMKSKLAKRGIELKGDALGDSITGEQFITALGISKDEAKSNGIINQDTTFVKPLNFAQAIVILKRFKDYKNKTPQGTPKFGIPLNLPAILGLQNSSAVLGVPLAQTSAVNKEAIKQAEKEHKAKSMQDFLKQVYGIPFSIAEQGKKLEEAKQKKSNKNKALLTILGSLLAYQLGKKSPAVASGIVAGYQGAKEKQKAEKMMLMKELQQAQKLALDKWYKESNIAIKLAELQKQPDLADKIIKTANSIVWAVGGDYSKALNMSMLMHTKGKGLEGAEGIKTAIAESEKERDEQIAKLQQQANNLTNDYYKYSNAGDKFNMVLSRAEAIMYKAMINSLKSGNTLQQAVKDGVNAKNNFLKLSGFKYDAKDNTWTSPATMGVMGGKNVTSSIPKVSVIKTKGGKIRVKKTGGSGGGGSKVIVTGKLPKKLSYPEQQLLAFYQREKAIAITKAKQAKTKEFKEQQLAVANFYDELINALRGTQKKKTAQQNKKKSIYIHVLTGKKLINQKTGKTPTEVFKTQ